MSHGLRDRLAELARPAVVYLLFTAVVALGRRAGARSRPQRLELGVPHRPAGRPPRTGPGGCAGAHARHRPPPGGHRAHVAHRDAGAERGAARRGGQPRQVRGLPGADLPPRPGLRGRAGLPPGDGGASGAVAQHGGARGGDGPLLGAEPAVRGAASTYDRDAEPVGHHRAGLPRRRRTRGAGTAVAPRGLQPRRQPLARHLRVRRRRLGTGQPEQELPRERVHRRLPLQPRRHRDEPAPALLRGDDGAHPGSLHRAGAGGVRRRRPGRAGGRQRRHHPRRDVQRPHPARTGCGSRRTPSRGRGSSWTASPTG